MNKKGQTGLIVIILIILIVLGAVVIVWNVVNGILKSSAEQVNLNSTMINLEITAAQINSANDIILVAINRPNGVGSITGLKFIFTDNNKKGYTYLYDVSSGLPVEKETRVYSIQPSWLSPSVSDFSTMSSVSVAAITETSSGKNFTSEIKDTETNLRSKTTLIVNTDLDNA